MNRFVFVSLLAMFSFVGCSSNPNDSASLKLYVFDCGRLNYDSIEFLGITDQETDIRDMIVPCYVIEHQKGRLLWEGGLPSSLAQHDGWQEMEGGWRMRLDRTLEDQLATIDLSMRDFDYMAFSHFHFDHVGTANEVEGATLIIQRQEYEAAFADNATALGYSPELYENLRQAEQIVIEGEHDVFGDGRVRLLPAPGHTPGHQVLYVGLSETGPVVLAGDLYVFRVGREKRRVLPIDVDTTLSLASMSQLESILEETGSTLWIGHELALYNEMKKPPQYHY